jgi:hypothetical protein
MSEVAANYDEAWKEALSEYFEDFLSFFFPNIHSLVDWNKTPIALDKELQQLKANADPNLRIADKLYEVGLLDKKTPSLVIHCEVQSQHEDNFDRRIFVYNTKAFTLCNIDVVSLVILGDTRRSWRPADFRYCYGGLGTGTEFGSFKLLDYQSRWDDLESTQSRFGIIIMAHLKTAATTGNFAERAQWKWEIVQKIYNKGWSNRDFIIVYNIVDTMMSLPKPLQAEFFAKVKQLEEDRKMPLISPTIALAREEGEQRGELKGKQELVIELLNHRFVEIPPSLTEQLKKLTNEQLRELGKAVFDFTTISDLETWLQNRPTQVEQ